MKLVAYYILWKNVVGHSYSIVEDIKTSRSDELIRQWRRQYPQLFDFPASTLPNSLNLMKMRANLSQLIVAGLPHIKEQNRAVFWANVSPERSKSHELQPGSALGSYESSFKLVDDNQITEEVPMKTEHYDASMEDRSGSAGDTYSPGMPSLLETRSNLIIGSAVAVPVVVLGVAITLITKRSRKEVDPTNCGGKVDDNYSSEDYDDSLSDISDDASESKFEVGNDAVVWAHQADFSAF